MKPRVFIGSSREGIQFAYAIQENLDHCVDCTVWDQDIFRPSRYTLEDLEDNLDSYDYTVFVLSPDDITTIRDKTQLTARDNVIFELGLFIGKIGRENCFFVTPRGMEDFHVPTDLLGLNPLTYNSLRPDGNLNALLGPVCNKIKKEVTSKLSDSVTAAKAKYDLLNNKYPSKRLIRYLDTACIFRSRSKFNACVNYQQLFESAKEISALGISLNEVTLNWEFHDILGKIKEGCRIRLLFLDPACEFMALREKDEGLERGTIAKITEANITAARKVKASTAASEADGFSFRLYSRPVSINMYIINNSIIVLQHYISRLRGQECPVFVVKNEQTNSGLFSLYVDLFEDLWQEAQSSHE